MYISATMYMTKLATILVVASTVAAMEWPDEGPCSPCHCSVQRNKFFSGLAKHANCSGRALSNVPSYLPRDLDSLDLSHNNIDSDSINVICGYKSLQILVLADNSITELDGTPFTDCSLLAMLDLSGNMFNLLQNGNFNGLENLQSLRGLQAKSVEHGLFTGMRKMDALDFTYMGSTIQENVFSDLPIETLKLSLHSVKDIPPKLFQFGAKTLHSLFFQGYDLLSLDENLFKSLTVLRKLHMNMPNLETIPERIFSNFSQGSKEKEEGPRGLQEIVISGINSIPSNIFNDLKILQVIEIHRVHEIAVSGLFDNLVNLISLNLTNSNVVKIPSGWFSDLYSLKVLNMSKCNLHSIEDQSLQGLRNLRTLDLSMNAIRFIPMKTFDPLRNSIQNMHLRGNMLKFIDNMLFRHMPVLRTLDLSDNKIANVTSDAFISLRLLTSLQLQENKLFYLPVNILRNQLNLQTLDLGRNSFRRIPISVMRSAGFLLRLELPNNKLVSIPPSLPDNLPYLEYLNLKGNSLRCKCRLFRIRQHKPDLYIDGHCLGGTRHVMTMKIPAECGEVLPNPDFLPEAPKTSTDYDYKGQYDYYGNGEKYQSDEYVYAYETETDYYYDVKNNVPVSTAATVTETSQRDSSAVLKPTTVSEVGLTSSVSAGSVKTAPTPFTNTDFFLATGSIAIIDSTDDIFGSTSSFPYQYTTASFQPTEPLSKGVFSETVNVSKSEAIVASTISEDESLFSMSKVKPSHSTSEFMSSSPAGESRSLENITTMQCSFPCNSSALSISTSGQEKNPLVSQSSVFSQNTHFLNTHHSSNIQFSNFKSSSSEFPSSEFSSSKYQISSTRSLREDVSEISSTSSLREDVSEISSTSSLMVDVSKISSTTSLTVDVSQISSTTSLTVDVSQISSTTSLTVDVSVIFQNPVGQEIETQSEMTPQVKLIVGVFGGAAIVCLIVTLWWLKNHISKRKVYEVSSSNTIV